MSVSASRASCPTTPAPGIAPHSDLQPLAASGLTHSSHVRRKTAACTACTALIAVVCLLYLANAGASCTVPPSPCFWSLIATDAHRSYMRLRAQTRRDDRTAVKQSSGPGRQAAGGHLRVHVANHQQWPQPQTSQVQHVGLSLPTFCLGTSPPTSRRRVTRGGRCSTSCGSFRPGSEGSGSASSFGAVILLSGNDVMPVWHVLGNETEGRGAGCHDARVSARLISKLGLLPCRTTTHPLGLRCQKIQGEPLPKFIESHHVVSSEWLSVVPSLAQRLCRKILKP